MDEGFIASEDIIGRQTDVEGFYLFCDSEIQEEFRFVVVLFKSSISIEVKATFNFPTGFVLPEQFGKSITSPVIHLCRIQADIAGSCIIHGPSESYRIGQNLVFQFCPSQPIQPHTTALNKTAAPAVESVAIAVSVKPTHHFRIIKVLLVKAHQRAFRNVVRRAACRNPRGYNQVEALGFVQRLYIIDIQSRVVMRAMGIDWD